MNFIENECPHRMIALGLHTRVALAGVASWLEWLAGEEHFVSSALLAFRMRAPRGVRQLLVWCHAGETGMHEILLLEERITEAQSTKQVLPDRIWRPGEYQSLAIASGAFA
jgi:hypothetical protein